ncbi:MAG: hypothetical protein V1905_00080 [bacterium]
MSALKEKIVLLLYAGAALGLSYSINRQHKIIKELDSRWQKINEKELAKEIALLYRSKWIDRKEMPDGSITLVLNNKGKIKALNYQFDEMKIKTGKWDGLWRLVIFDIPEKYRRGRDALREKLIDLGFRELQKSAFVFPYPCQDEVEFIVEFFNLRPFVRQATVKDIDNGLHLKKKFHLI